MELTLDEALQKGIEAHKVGRVHEADKFYTAILQSQPKHPDANHNMGVLAVGVGKAQEALPFFKTALEANPSIVQFWLSYIDALIKLGKIFDATAMLDQAKDKGITGEAFEQLEASLNRSTETSILPELAPLLHQATGHREAGEFPTAITLLTDRFNEISSNAELLSLLAHCYILNDDEENASIYLDKAKKIDPNNASVGWNDVRLLLKKKNVADALIVAKRTNGLFPDDIEGMGVLGACLRANNEIEESLLYLEKAITLNPNYVEALINRGLIRLSQKDRVEALSDLESAHKLKPHIKQIWDLVIGLKVGFEQFGEAIALLTDIIKIDQNDETNYIKLALCNEKLNNLDAAIESYKQAIQIRPGYAEAYNNMGVLLKQKGDLDAAIESYKPAIKIKPDYAEAYNNMGVALQDKGELDAAIYSYKQAISSNPDLAEVYSNMGAALRDKDELKAAIDSYKQALNINPDYAEAHRGMGTVYYFNKQYREAKDCFDRAGNRKSVAMSLECTYCLEDYDTFSDTLSYIVNNDSTNIRVAAISAFYSHQLQRKDIYPFSKDAIELISYSHIKNHVLDVETVISEIINEANLKYSVWNSNTTKSGFHTSGNIFSEPSKNIRLLENIIRKEIDLYYSKYRTHESTLIQCWPAKINLQGWYVRMIQNGYQDSHIHPGAWISGVVYLKTINNPIQEEGAIEFGLHGYDYPIKRDDYPRRRHQPSNGEIVLFPSSLFHRTIPVIRDVERCVIAFDLLPPISV